MATSHLDLEAAADGRVLAFHARECELVEAPIEPGWVLEGEPRARMSQWLGSRDGTVAGFSWDCTAGRFHWYFAADETVHVLEGAVVVSTDTLRPTRLGPGDAAHFDAGTWAVWEVPEYVRKHAVLRTHLPRPIALQARAWGVLSRWRHARRVRARHLDPAARTALRGPGPRR